MAHMKLVLGRLMVSTVWIVIMTGVGAFFGAIAGALLELGLQAMLGIGSPALIIPAVMLAGGGWAFLWATRIAILHRQVPSRLI